MEYEFIENPIVGKFYNVPCIRKYGTERLIAILPLKHSDPQFGTFAASLEHYHFDTRFFSKADFQLYLHTDFKERTSHVHITDKRFPGSARVNEIRILRRKCHRVFGGLLGTEIPTIEMQRWYRKQIGKSCAGRICPHFRQPMLERDGVLECPYHGLIGDIKTEKIIGNIHGITRLVFSGKD